MRTLNYNSIILYVDFFVLVCCLLFVVLLFYPGNTQQTNNGEDFDSIEGFNLSDYSLFFQFENIWTFVAFIDLLIIYRRLIALIARAVEFHNGKIKVEDASLYMSRIDGSHLKTMFLKLKSFCGVFDSVTTFFQDILPLVLIGIGFSLVYGETESFFEIDAITNLGIYNIFTAPVIAAQYRTNVYLSSKQDSYNKQLLPSLSSTMNINIQSIEDTLSEFNLGQFENVTYYNTEKCSLQISISSYIDTLKCFEKYYDFYDQTNICDNCASDLKAMCMSGGEYIKKEVVGDKLEVSESEMSERRKYCEFDNSVYDIDWTINNEKDANSTIKTPNWDNSLEATCPDGMIIQSIYFRGSGDYKVNTNSDWQKVSENYPFIWKTTGTTWSNARSQCENIGSNLASITTSFTDDVIADSVTTSSEYWIGMF